MPRRPSYVPVDLLQDRGAWDVENPAWKSTDSFDEAALIAASRLQQRLSLKVWRRLRASGLRVQDLAASLGDSEDQLWRKLAGKAPASIVDLARWAALVDDEETLAGALSSFQDIEPPWPTSRQPGSPHSERP